jgi:hypothetical protein
MQEVALLWRERVFSGLWGHKYIRAHGRKHEQPGQQVEEGGRGKWRGRQEEEREKHCVELDNVYQRHVWLHVTNDENSDENEAFREGNEQSRQKASEAVSASIETWKQQHSAQREATGVVGANIETWK